MSLDLEIVAARRYGFTMSQIGARCGGISKQRVHQILKRNGMTGRRKDLIDCDRVETLRARGLSASEIGEKLSCSETSVYRILKALEGHRRHKAG